MTAARARKRTGATRARAVGRARVPPPPAVVVRTVRRGDLEAVIALDATVTGLAKHDYWRGVFRRYGGTAAGAREFLVAIRDGAVVGFIIGEVRDWEFGSPPCGWVFAIDVAPDARLAGVGTRLLAAIGASFRRARRAQAAHAARARQHADPLVLPQPRHDRGVADSAGDGP